MLLMLDNYDSFTFNLVQYFRELNCPVRVVRNDELTAQQVMALQPAAICISPGPCRPEDAGISIELISLAAGQVPLLGVCLGHQAIAQAFGAKIIRAQQIMHGKTSVIRHYNSGVFAGLPNPLTVVRYHSLAVDSATLPSGFEITAQCQDGEIMGIRHPQMGLEGVQFHPESILSDRGHDLLRNFVQRIPC